MLARGLHLSKLAPKPRLLVYGGFRVMQRSMAVVPFKLADIGEGIAEVELMQWFVKKGDSVKSFDKICEVQSDKATVEITSKYAGVIDAVHHEVGSIVKVGDALVDISVSDGKASSGSSAASSVSSASNEKESNSSNSQAATSKSQKSKSGPVLTTPAVRRLAREYNVDLHKVRATGPKGRVVKADLLNFVRYGPTQSPEGESPVEDTRVTGTEATSSQSTPARTSSFFAPGETTKTVPIRGVQRLMVKSMNAAREVQTFVYGDEVTVDKLVELRREIVKDTKDSGVKFSFMPLLLKAASLALLEYPLLNSTVNSTATEITYHASHNIGMAVDTPKGLIVPVIRDVQSKSLLEIAGEITRLQVAAAENKLTEADLKGGTFTLSNIGAIGGTYMMPVLVVPQVCIGALGKFQVVPKYVMPDGSEAKNDAIYSGEAVVKPRTIMNISWSADHRVVDGATAARFSNQWKKYLENPSAMLTKMI